VEERFGCGTSGYTDASIAMAPPVLVKPLAGWDLADSRLLQARREAGRLFGLCEHASEIAPRAAATGYENVRDHCAYIRHLPNKRFAQINSNGSVASTSDKRRVVVTIKGGTQCS
jgi:hypothetical protein